MSSFAPNESEGGQISASASHVGKDIPSFGDLDDGMQALYAFDESQVEKTALKNSGRKFMYDPIEKIPVIEVSNFPELGVVTSMRFLEWCQKNPNGVISLPTGKTPEHFINITKQCLNAWDSEETQSLLKQYGVNPAICPEMKSFHFVQMDDFYPIDPTQNNSFLNYVRKYYIEGFGMDPEKALLMDFFKIGCPEKETAKDVFPHGQVDLSLRTRNGTNESETQQKHVIEEIDQMCSKYEENIRNLGGIGFFLGGIGPDGHIAFNIRGSDHYSTTRLCPTNYETQAAAATDLGGIEIAKHRLVTTIGLHTIKFNPNAVAIIFAAGEAKAHVVADSVQKNRSIRYPATALRLLRNARFYLSKGAASELIERKKEDYINANPLSASWVHRAIFDLSKNLGKCITELSSDDLCGDPLSKIVYERWVKDSTELDLKAELNSIVSSLTDKIEKGMKVVKNTTFLHTAPHHDDLMLGYLPYIVHLTREPTNSHVFAYATSGFNAVTNHYMLEVLNLTARYISEDSEVDSLWKENYFEQSNTLGYDRDVFEFLDGVACRDSSVMNQAISRRMVRILKIIYGDNTLDRLQNRVMEHIRYWSTSYPGEIDAPLCQRVKGMMREFEADCLWQIIGFRDVHHLRLQFYQGKQFTEEPSIDKDVQPILKLLRKTEPDVVTVALDPEAAGPDTHYKVLQAVAEALRVFIKESKKEIRVWGYRNVWYRFHPSDANIFVPLSINTLSILDEAFVSCFVTQKSASFPSYQYDGPFSQLSRRIWSDQFLSIKKSVGRKFFLESPLPRLRASHGMCYVKELSVEEFLNSARELKKSVE